MIRTFGLARLVLVLACAAPVLSACGSDESPPPPPSSSNAALAGASSTSAGDSSASSSASTVSCTDKQVRECRVELGQQGTVQNCFVGLQLCTNGAWGPCLSPAEIEAQLNAQ